MNRPRCLALALSLVLAGCGSTAPRGDGKPDTWMTAPVGDHLLALGEQVGDDPVIPVGAGIVDVNSVIHVALQKERIGTAVPKDWDAKFPPERLDALKQLSKAIEDGQASLEKLRAGLREWSNSKKESPEARAAAVEKLDSVFRSYAQPFSVIIEALDGAPDLRNRFNLEMEGVPDDASQVEQDVIVLRLAGELVQREQAALDTFVKANGIFFQLGAWLVSGSQSTSIHLPGFDTYPEQEYYEVERWSIRFDAKQQEEFKTLAKSAKDLNDKLVQPGSYFNTYRDAVVAAFKQALESCADELQKTLDQLIDEAKNVTLDPDPKQLQTQIKAFAQKLRELKAKYESIDLKDPIAVLAALDGLRTDIKEVKRDAGEILGTAKKLIAAVKAISPSAKLKELLDKFESEASEDAKSCLGALHLALDPILTALGVDLAASHLNEDLLEFTDQVLRHTLDSLPASTEFDLHTSGKRDAGDRVILKFAAGRERPGPDGKPKPDREVLETRRLTLYRILPHLTTTVGLIWANPVESTSLTRDYQAGASYSVLYKWGNRSSDAFNSLWSPGIGLNLAALDLDKDDNPDLGAGAVFSVVRDYIQVGYGYDFSAGSAYWFFGFRLPLPTWTLSDGGNP